jgi:hypothetical protein
MRSWIFSVAIIVAFLAAIEEPARVVAGAVPIHQAAPLTVLQQFLVSSMEPLAKSTENTAAPLSTEFAGMPLITLKRFSWRSPNHRNELPAVSSFATLVGGTDSPAKSDIDRLLSREIAVRSNGILPNVDVWKLGLLIGYSAMTFDAIAFTSAPMGNVTAQTLGSADLPEGVKSITRFEIGGDIELLLAKGTFSSESDAIASAIHRVADNTALNWQTVAARPMVFYNDSQTFLLPDQIYISNDNGVIFRTAHQAARFSIGTDLEFATVLQANYYSPGCCWDFPTTTPALPDALLVAWIKSSDQVLYAHTGHLGQ